MKIGIADTHKHRWSGWAAGQARISGVNVNGFWWRAHLCWRKSVCCHDQHINCIRFRTLSFSLNSWISTIRRTMNSPWIEWLTCLPLFIAVAVRIDKEETRCVSIVSALDRWLSKYTKLQMQNKTAKTTASTRTTKKIDSPRWRLVVYTTNIFIAVKRTQTHKETDLKRKKSATTTTTTMSAAAAAAAMKKIYSVRRSNRGERIWLESKPVNILNYIGSGAVGGERAKSKLKRIRLTIHSLNQSEKRQTVPERGRIGSWKKSPLKTCDMRFNGSGGGGKQLTQRVAGVLIFVFHTK